eukprot:TRINITY_DN16220_c0_g1_i1.p1 TRINITY_DN16220_c0_g1~~TRINITY_DN16220_c0_g1_i1.p1  ORF type:complete len:732 (+),score=134.56 TRINITY_DN16220_c0_g1_i1:125-2320(+)
MDESNELVMEGWLYLLDSRMFSSRPRKRYFVLDGTYASWYKAKPGASDEEPIKSGHIDSYYMVDDNGREKIHGRVLYVFTLYDPHTHQEHLKFGASSAEETARWMRAFRSAADQAEAAEPGDAFLLSTKKKHALRSTRGGPVNNSRTPTNVLLDWTQSLSNQDGQADVVTTSPWRIFGCRNGLRLFKETSDEDFQNKLRSYDPPAVMAVGTINSTCESIFATILGLGSSRLQWDFCFVRGKVIERVDGHTDIIHEQYNSSWISCKMRPRDLLLVRYWRREDDGSYAILYRSVEHEKCPPQQGFKRAWLKSGGYVISPLAPNKTIVKHMIAVNWRLRHISRKHVEAEDISIRILERISALREMYEALPPSSAVNHAANAHRNRSKYNGQEQTIENLEGQDRADEDQENNEVKTFSFSEVAEKFYDVSESPLADSDDDSMEMDGTDDEEESPRREKAVPTTKFPTAAGIVKRLHDLALTAQNRNQPAKSPGEENDLLSQKGSLPNRTNSVTQNCWCAAEPDTFRVRSKSYLRNQAKVKAGDPIMKLIACDWLKSDKREGHLARRSGNIVNSFQGKGGSDPFFLVLNVQVPGTATSSLVLYYITRKPLESVPLLKKFVEGDDRYRNSRFKLIPNIAKGSWIVKQSVGKTACLIGQALEIDYHRGSNYLEADINIGSSSVARGVVSLVLGYIGKLIVEMAFLIQAESEEELPEQLLGTCRLLHLDMGKAVGPPPE